LGIRHQALVKWYFGKNLKIALASDHAGYPLKEAVKEYLLSAGYEVEDFGGFNTEAMDYPDSAHPAAESVASGKNERGIFICGTGQGMQLTANKHRGIRAALCWMPEIARLSRLHNDTNVLTMPGRFFDGKTAVEMVKVWLDTPFEGGRHKRRVEKIEDI